ncbi:MAG: hypothetical protein HY741_27740 [Chloroflexi bacterium]|nr:hypothetical protein [Chloroflexota bacterium]
MTTQSLLHWRNGNLDAAVADGELSAEIAERIGLAMYVVIGYWGAGWVHGQRGEYSAAVAALEAARRAAEPFAGFIPFLSVMSEATLGSVMLEGAFPREAALNYHKHALALSSSPVGGMSNGSAWADMGWCALNLGNLDLAHKLFEGALTYPSFFRLVMRPRNLLGLAELAKLRGDFETAQKRIDEARALAEEKAMRPFQAIIALADGKLQAARGLHERALELFADAETRAAALQMRPTILEAQLAAASSFTALGRTADAERKYAQAHALTNEIAALIADDGMRQAYLEQGSLRLEMPASVRVNLF